MIHKIISVIPPLILASTVHAASIPNYAVADLVLGQANFNVSVALPLTASALDRPSAVVIDPVSRKVFVADQDNNRVLRYSNADALTNGAAAEVVFGQPDFFQGGIIAPPTNKSMRTPTGLFFDHLGRLWVADRENHRVLRFDAASMAATNPSASVVYGQPDFTTSTPSVAANRMWDPHGIWLDSSDRLWVADSYNYRVLRFDNISTKASGAAADGVLGQSDFITDVEGTGATGLQYPTGLVVSPSGALFVVCQNGSRVLRYNNAPTLANGAAATVALGQPNLNATAAGLSATQMNKPDGLAITLDDSLWVCDSINNRVIRFDQASTKATGSAANGVIGQPDFVTSNPNNITSQGLRLPRHSPFVDSIGNLWVPDGNRRVLRFPAIKALKLAITFSKATGPGGQDQVNISGAGGTANATLLMEVSTNLITWTNLQNVSLTSTGTFNATINQAAGIPKRFFRLNN